MLKTIQIVGDSKYGGATYLIREWCKYLLARQVQVQVLSTDQQTIRELRKIPDLEIIDNIFIPREISPLMDLKAFIKLLRLFRREGYDVVHTYTATPGFLGRIAARLAGIPVILHHQAAWTVTEFSTLKERLLYPPLEYLVTWSSSRSICVSHAVAEEARRLKIAPLGKLVTICNGIEPGKFMAAASKGRDPELRRKLGLPAEALVIGSTGRLAAQKDYETLVRAVPFLIPLLPHQSFIVMVSGDGPERLPLETLVRSLGLEGLVHFSGFRQDIPEFLASLDIFVSPSLREGLSISLLEDMAAARPIVATAILPNMELIEPEVTGLLVPPRNPGAMAQAITRLAQNPALANRCGNEAQQRVLKHYSIDRMFQETWNLYISLWESQTCRRFCLNLSC